MQIIHKILDDLHNKFEVSTPGVVSDVIKKVVEKSYEDKTYQYGLKNGTCRERLTISPLVIMKLSVNAKLMKRMNARRK